MKLGYLYAGKVLGNLAPGGVDPYTGDPSAHMFTNDLGEGGDPITDTICPMYIVTDDWHNWDDPTTPSSDVFGLLVSVQVGVTPGGTSAVLRLAPNMPAGVTLDSAINIPIGRADALKYLFELAPATTDAWGYGSGTHTGQNGWLKIHFGAGIERYVQLYDTFVA